MITSIIFDLDGVITSTDEYNYLTWKEMADELGIYFDRKINEQFRGISRIDCVKIFLENYKGEKSDSLENEMSKKKNQLYQKYLKQMSPSSVSDDVKNTLNELKNRKYKMAIGSSSQNTSFILKQIGYSDFFDGVADGTQIKNSKPDPEVFLLAANKINSKPEECIVIGDAKADIEAAIAGNMKSASISYAAKIGLGDYQLNKLSDLLAILK